MCREFARDYKEVQRVLLDFNEILTDVTGN